MGNAKTAVPFSEIVGPVLARGLVSGRSAADIIAERSALFQCNFNILAETEGFEPSIRVEARITV